MVPISDLFNWKILQFFRLLEQSSKQVNFTMTYMCPPEKLVGGGLRPLRRKSCVLPQFLIYLRYISDASQLQALQVCLNRSLSTTLHVYGHPTALLAAQAFPLFTLHRTYNLHNSDLDCTPHPLPLFNISSGNFGSPYYNLCPSTHSKPACRLQYVMWTWPTMTLLPLCPKM